MFHRADRGGGVAADGHADDHYGGVDRRGLLLAVIAVVLPGDIKLLRDRMGARAKNL